MPDVYGCQLSLAHVSGDDYRKLFEELLIEAEHEKSLRELLAKTILEERERRDGNPFRLSPSQQKMMDRLEADAVGAREEMKRNYANRMADEDILRIAYGTEKHAFEMDGRLWRDKKGNLSRPLEQQIQDLSERCLKKIESFAAQKQLRLSFV